MAASLARRNSPLRYQPRRILNTERAINRNLGDTRARVRAKLKRTFAKLRFINPIRAVEIEYLALDRCETSGHRRREHGKPRRHSCG